MNFANAYNLAMNGQEEGFRFLYDNSAQSVYEYLLTALGDQTKADDMIGKVYDQAWAELGTLNYPNDFPGWVYRIAENMVKNGAQNEKNSVKAGGKAGNSPAKSVGSSGKERGTTARDSRKKASVLSLIAGKMTFEMGIIAVVGAMIFGVYFYAKKKTGSDNRSEHVVKTVATTTEASTFEQNTTQQATYEASYEEETEESYSDTDFKWQNYSATFTDPDGYVLKKTIKISGWINGDDTELLNAAWDEISNGKELRVTPSEMGFHDGEIYLKDRYGSTFSWYREWNEVDYAVGYLEVENETDGFSFTEDKTHSTYINFGTNKVASIKVFYSDPQVIYQEQNAYDGEMNTYYQTIRPKMKSDRWKVPFVLALAVTKTPNYPEGSPNPKNCLCHFEGCDDFYLPVTWE